MYMYTYRHSLLATELISKVNAMLEVRLRVQDLFSFPTLSSLCKLIDSRLNKDSKTSQEEALPKLDLEAEVENHDVCVVKYVHAMGIIYIHVVKLLRWY